MDPQALQVSQALAQRRLSTRDKRLQGELQMSEQEQAADVETDLSPGNINALRAAIMRERDPRKQAALIAEAKRLQLLREGILSTQKQMPLMPPQGNQPAYLQNAPYDPSHPAERWGGQQQTGPLPAMSY